MEDIFLTILQNGIHVCWLILAVLVLRLVLYRAPHAIHRALWLVVGLKLLIPVTISGPFSFIPDISFQDAAHMETDSSGQLSEVPAANTADGFSNQLVLAEQPVWDDNNRISGASDMQKSVPDTAFAGIRIGTRCGKMTCLWLAGICLMILYFAGSLLLLRKKTRTAVRLYDNVWQCDCLSAPFIIGFVKPKIYIPFSISDQELYYVLAHEQSHIRRLDHCMKPLGFLLLSIYWFHPLVWLSYILMCRDMEFACDERVIAPMSPGERRAYSESLLSCSSDTKKTLTSLAFAKSSVKSRIRSVLAYRKWPVWMIICATVLCAVIVTGFATMPSSAPEAPDTMAEEEHVTDTTAFVQAWAQAFCDRNGAYIAAHSSDTVIQALMDAQLLDNQESGYSFGDSSPWPDFFDKDSYEIVNVGTDSAEILYYAAVSDPHVEVWRETLHLKLQNGDYQVTNETLVRFDEIGNAADFALAYPSGNFSGAMDYAQNGMGEVLADRVAKDLDTKGFATVLSPAQSASAILNLSNDVSIYAYQTTDSSAMVWLWVKFTDGSSVRVEMKDFHGAGVWIPVKWNADSDEMTRAYEDSMHAAEQFVSSLPLSGTVTLIYESAGNICRGMDAQMPSWTIETNREALLYHCDTESVQYDAWRSEGYVTAASFARIMNQEETEASARSDTFLQEFSPTAGMNHCESKEYQTINDNVSVWTMYCDAYTRDEIEQYRIPADSQVSQFWVIKCIDNSSQMVYLLHLNQKCYSFSEVEQLAKMIAGM